MRFQVEWLEDSVIWEQSRHDQNGHEVISAFRIQPSTVQ